MVSAKEYLLEKGADLQSLFISGDTSIEQSFCKLNEMGLGVLLVVDTNKKLEGIITDGDLRRAIINHMPLENPCSSILSSDPVVASEGMDFSEMEFLFDHNHKHVLVEHIPVINSEGMVVDVLLRIGHLAVKKSNKVVIMAGGLGSRLGHLTNDCPKPMLKIYDKPLLEILLEKFRAEGFSDFIFSLNYKSEVIQSHFKNGNEFGVNIDYVIEKKRLGTAGALSLLNKETLTAPLIVMNGDIITKVSFKSLLDFHRKAGLLVTVCSVKRSMSIPYGVIENDNHLLKKIDEKPIKEFHINAGIYILNPEALDIIPKDQFFDMTDLINFFIEQEQVAVFPIHEYWVDVGCIEDLERAKSDRRLLYEFT